MKVLVLGLLIVSAIQGYSQDEQHPGNRRSMMRRKTSGGTMSGPSDEVVAKIVSRLTSPMKKYENTVFNDVRQKRDVPRLDAESELASIPSRSRRGFKRKTSGGKYNWGEEKYETVKRYNPQTRKSKRKTSGESLTAPRIKYARIQQGLKRAKSGYNGY